MEEMKGLIIILRGPPRCGKTTLARAILKTYTDSICALCSYDDYFYSSGIADQGVYLKDVSEKTARDKCTKDLRQKMCANKQIIVFDGVNRLKRDYKFIRELAKSHYYGVKRYEFFDEEAERREKERAEKEK
eukprot:UN29886